MPAIIATATATATGIKTYRHEFSKEFMAELSRFSKVHQYDDRQTYKSEWQKWTSQDEIAEAMEVERRRLQENGYTGDIDDKMFKAGRYYFRKKSSTIVPDQTTTTVTTTDDNNIATDPPSPAAPAQRRTYITMSKQCIRLMDEHIQRAAASTPVPAASTPAAPSAVFKPSVCYDDFYQTQMTTAAMTTEIGNIIEKYEKTPGAMSNQTADELTEEIMDKIKKTYKNRYYKYVSSMRRSDGGDNDNDNDNEDTSK